MAIDWEIKHKIFNSQLNLYSRRDQGTQKKTNETEQNPPNNNN